MLLLDATLEPSKHPPHEQRGDVVNARRDFVGLIVPAIADRHGMHVVRSREAGISLRTCVKGIPILSN